MIPQKHVTRLKHCSPTIERNGADFPERLSTQFSKREQNVDSSSDKLDFGNQGMHRYKNARRHLQGAAAVHYTALLKMRRHCLQTLQDLDSLGGD